MAAHLAGVSPAGADWSGPIGRAHAGDLINRRLLGVADVVAASLGLALSAAITDQRLVLPSALTLPLILLIMKTGGRYDFDEVVIRKSTLDEAPALMGLAATYALAWSVVTLAFGIHSSRGAVLVLWCGTGASVVGLRMLVRALGRLWAGPERVLIVGRRREGESVGRRLSADPLTNAEIVGYIRFDDIMSAAAPGAGYRPHDSWTAGSDNLRTIVTALGVDRVVVVLSSGDSESALETVAAAADIGSRVSIVPSILEVIGSAAEFDELGGVTVLSLKRSGLNRSSAWVKRGMDILGALIGLILTAPLSAVIAVVIKLDSPGPILFCQHRIGRGGRVFPMIKFRSMIEEAEGQRPELEPFNESEGIFKMSRDPRVTRFGRFLRQTSLDELPQLINVLRGEMSLVGPRPLVFDEDQRVLGRHRTRLQYAPGMTGPWQVLGPTRPPLAEMVKLDYLYGANWSVWSDMKYILRTISHVLSRRGL